MSFFPPFSELTRRVIAHCAANSVGAIHEPKKSAPTETIVFALLKSMLGKTPPCACVKP